MRRVLFIAFLVLAPFARAQIAGGWSVIEQPSEDHDAREAGIALVRHLPVKNVSLRHIERASRQVVAGTNFRLTIKLTNGRLWCGTVWRKLDGTYVVSRVARVRSLPS